MNSIHFSKGNNSTTAKTFVVYRFESEKIKVNKESVDKYNKCYEQHLKLMKINQ